MPPPTLFAHYTQQAQIDADYNPSLQGADGPAEMRAYAERSAATRERLAGRLGLAYGPTRAETLDIFPAPQAGAPVLFFVHGGYWRALSSRDFSCVAAGAHARGWCTVVMDYALCPWVTIDEIVRQVRAALAWTWHHIGEHGGDRERLVLAGHSAGGQLGAMALQTDWAGQYGLPADPLRAALLVSGLYELAPLRHSYLQPVIQLDEGLVARNSPMRAVRACATPLWLTWGSRESSAFAWQSQAHGQAWAAAGNRGRVEALPEADHFSAIHGLERPDSPHYDWLAAQLA